MRFKSAWLAAGAAAVLAPAARRRVMLSRAKHGSLAGHPRISLRIARLMPAIDHDEAQMLACDGAPPDIVARRRAGLERLGALYAERYPKSRALTAEARSGLSDLQFTGLYRVPFSFAKAVRGRLGVGAFVERSEGVMITDLDGNRFYDLTGSYGVNVLGYDVYKRLIDDAVVAARDLGPVLGQLHPVVADNVAQLRELTGLDEISFHMSGTEAVMQAVRLARYHTGRSHAVRFCGAYHGWWGDVQPGVGNPTSADNTYTLADMSERTLAVLRTRRDIACVLINPLQALHPNVSAASDNALVEQRRGSRANDGAYAAWLGEVQAVCRARGIVVILDDVFTGFRLAPGTTAARLGIRPDMITLGKTLGGGFPVGVVAGRATLMKRFCEDRPLDLCFARGTFNAHPYVMTAMNGFLRQLQTPATAALYEGLEQRWNIRADRLNAGLAETGLPIRVANLSSIWTVLYERPSRMNWMLQYYLRAEGLLLSWVGTGRLIFSLNYSDDDFAEVAARFVRAAVRMEADGWFWCKPEATGKSVRRALMRQLVARRLGH